MILMTMLATLPDNKLKKEVKFVNFFLLNYCPCHFSFLVLFVVVVVVVVVVASEIYQL